MSSELNEREVSFGESTVSKEEAIKYLQLRKDALNETQKEALKEFEHSYKQHVKISYSSEVPDLEDIDTISEIARNKLDQSWSKATDANIPDVLVYSSQLSVEVDSGYVNHLIKELTSGNIGVDMTFREMLALVYAFDFDLDQAISTRRR